MTRRISLAIHMRNLLLLLLLAGFGSVVAQDADSDGPGATRSSITTQSTRAQRDRGEKGSVREDEFPALVTAGDRDTGDRSVAKSKRTRAKSMSLNNDFWFYNADVILFNDFDFDGYYHGIDLLFDADTYYDFAEVYAVVYLSLEGGPWNEYSATDNFILSGASADDEYVIVTELVSGYPRGSYDLLIELFDAFDDSFLASFGPEDTSELAFLVLEDAQRDSPAGTTVIIEDHHHGGGALSWPMLLLLAPFAYMRGVHGYWQNWARNGLRRRFLASSWRRMRRK